MAASRSSTPSLDRVRAEVDPGWPQPLPSLTSRSSTPNFACTARWGSTLALCSLASPAHLYQMQRAAVAGVASNPSDGGADMLPMHAAVDVLWRTYAGAPAPHSHAIPRMSWAIPERARPLPNK